MLVDSSKNHKSIIITIFNEIFIVKYGTKKFLFHLRGYHFLIQIDNSSFPKVVEFKNKTFPNAQLLRMKEWFAKYDLSV